MNSGAHELHANAATIDNPKPKARRALTFIAKILMALGNMSTFGAKEPWMENANSFLSSHRQQFKDFIDNICSIPSETATSITAIQPSYSTPLAILQRLAPGSREGFPSLPYLIDHARSFAELVDLWLENTKNQAGTMQEAGSGGDLARFNNVCVQLRKRTQDVLARAEPAERPGSALDAKWEAVVEDLVQDSGLALGTSPPGPAAMGQLYGAPPGSSHGRSAGGERGGPAGAATSMSSSTSQYAASESTADEQLAGAEQGMGSLELNGNGEGFWMEEDDESDVVKGRMWTANEGREGDTTALPSMGRMGNTTRITGKVAAEEASRSREKIFSFGRKKKR